MSGDVASSMVNALTDVMLSSPSSAAAGPATRSLTTNKPLSPTPVPLRRFVTRTLAPRHAKISVANTSGGLLRRGPSLRIMEDDPGRPQANGTRSPIGVTHMT